MEYSFTLKFKLPGGEVVTDEEIMTRLGEAGCTDALVGLGLPGYVSLEFQREAENALSAIVSAWNDVRQALPKGTLVEAGPDFVGLTDIAEVAGVSRQSMRKLFISYSHEFPPPVHGGTTMVWHLAPVLQYMASRRYLIDDSVRDVAYAAMQVNLSKETLLLNQEVAHEVKPLLRFA
jgi:hypothetical protein